MLAGVTSLGAIPKRTEYQRNHQSYFQTPTIEQYLHQNFPETKTEEIILRWDWDQRILTFENMPAKDWKISICSRQYLKYPSLYDTTVAMALVSENDIGLVIQLAASGVSKDTSLALTKKFIQYVTWQK